MDIVVRRAKVEDVPFLTSISYGVKRCWGAFEEYLTPSKEELIITEEYLNQNIVFVAQHKEAIIGYCSLHEVKKAYSINDYIIEQGYWLEYIFIRPAYIQSGVGTKLIEQVKEYCRQNEIGVFSVLSRPDIKRFYEKVGAKHIEEIGKLFGQEVYLLRFDIRDNKLKKNTLSEKICALDKDFDEEEPENIHIEKTISSATGSEDKEYVIDREEAIKRLSYEELLNSTVPIGYKFECEEEAELLVDEKETNPEGMDMRSEMAQQNIMEELSKEEIEALLGTGSRENAEIQEREKEQAVAEEINKEVEELMAATMETNLKENIVEQEKVEDNSILISTSIEKAKMLAGEMYIAWGEEIVEDRKHARKLLKEFNEVDPEDKRATHAILRKLFGKVGEYVHIEPSFKCSYGYNIEVGDNFYAGYNCVIVDHAPVKIGDNCIISPQVGIYTLAYPLNAERRIAGYEYAKPVTIGDNVWIGGGTTINPGVTIGKNVVVSPGSVIVSDIPDNVLIGGNPAKIIRSIEG